MTAFWDTVAANTTQAKSGLSLVATAAAVTTAGVIRSGGGGSVPQKWGLASRTSNIINDGDVRAKAPTATPAARKKTDDERQQQLPGPGGALSPEAADTCLQLLADAREAYEGQGFALQADGAARLDDVRVLFVGTRARVRGADAKVETDVKGSSCCAVYDISSPLWRHPHPQPPRSWQRCCKHAFDG